MAKKQIKNYVFKPGIGALDYVYPDAYSLLSQNKDFLISESIAYINQEIIDAVKCQRDIGYIIDGAIWDIAFGTNYNAIFLGLTELNSLDVSNTVIRTINRARNRILLLPTVAADSTATARTNAFFNEVIDVAKNGRSSADTHVYPNPTTATTSKIAAKDKIIANLDFLAAEVNAWVNVNYPDHDHDVDKCTRDTKYALYAAAYDILYGGNTASYDSAKFFYYFAASGTSGISVAHQAQTVAAYRHLQTIISAVVRGVAITPSAGNTQTQVTSGNNATVGDGSAVAALIDIVADVVESGTGALPGSRTEPSIGWVSAGLQAVRTEIVSNKTTIIEAVTWDPSYTYNSTKCQRDLGYVIDAYLYDLRYGGNEKLRNTIKYYWDQDVAQVDGNRIPEIDTHAFITDLITDYIITNTAWAAEGDETQVIDSGKTAENTFFTPSSVIYTPSSGKMVLTVGTHSLEVGDTILITEGGLTFTCAYDSNATTHPYPRAAGVPNEYQKDPYYNKEITITEVTATTITVNVGISSNTTTHTFVSAETNCIVVGAKAKLISLGQGTVDVITNGLDAMPHVIPAGVGTIKLQGRYDIEDFLLITNSTKNEIIFNFSNNNTGGNVSFLEHNTDSDFVTWEQTTDAVTTLTLNYNTSTHSDTDQIQIFVEGFENGKSIAYTRPHDFGTDAIERMRIAPPLSMLDADFEYGLQPTKWSAIGTMRGYPSVYELPGTDTEVVSVTTDASLGFLVRAFNFTVTNSGTTNWSVSGSDRLTTYSAAGDPTLTIKEGDTINFVNNATSTHPFYIKTVGGAGTANQVSGVDGQGGSGGATISWTPPPGSAGTYYYQCSAHAAMQGIITVQAGEPGTGVGQSLITVTTVAGHGFVQGDPITIKALENSVSGAARAEGAFVINSIPANNQFTYYAKAKVGTTNGEVLSTNYTQLRAAGFYTGASIGTPSVSVVSNGSTGTMVVELNVPVGSNIIPFDGTIPEIGAPLSGTNIPLGSQVTGIRSTSAGGGEYITPGITESYPIGTTEISVVNPAGIEVGLAADRGDGTATFITSIDGSTLNFSDEFTIPIVAGFKTSTGVSGTNDTSSGAGAQFTISRSSGVYTVVAITVAGSNYEIGDRIEISGLDLGGASPTNDLVLLVTGVDGSGGITTVNVFSGTAFGGSGTFTNLSGIYQHGAGVGLRLAVTFANNVYTLVDNLSPDLSQDWAQYDRALISGADLGGTGTNDITLSITSVGTGGSVTGFTSNAATQPAPDANQTFTNVPWTTSGAGTGATVDVEMAGSVYFATITGGINFLPTDTIVVSGLDLEGTAPVNDLTITIDNVDGTGAPTAWSESGVASNTQTVFPVIAVPLNGNGATFDVELAAGSYTVTTNTAGIQYAANQQIVIPGAVVGGVTPANDITITVTSVGASGVITGISYTGTGASASGSYTAVEGFLQAPTGSSATFDVTRINGSYTNVAINEGGTGYNIGNRITIPGTLLDGVSPDNDVYIDVTGAVGGVITAITYTAGSAVSGTIIPLISTITMTEETTGVILKNANVLFDALATLEVTFETAHGLVPGDTFIVVATSDDGTNNHSLAGGSFFASEIPSITSLRYQARAPGTIDDSLTDIVGTVYPRPDSFFIHRPFDGGVQLGTGGPQHGAQAIRQSKKYIRYQSGKGIMYTTGALFAPSYDLRSLTAEDIEVGSLITVVTDDNDHGVQVGGIIRLLGVVTPGYNSGPGNSTPPYFDYEVVDVDDERTFKVRAQRRLGSTNAVLGFGAQMSVVSWHGATVRSGIFDDQNGIFWEYDGTQISVVQRTGTFQCAGTIAIGVDSNQIVGTNTRFRQQLKAGDRVIIKGMTHVVSHVTSDTLMTVTPDFRGVTEVQAAKMMLVTDKKVKQRDFNLDRLDGTGPSGYDLDPAKMQMIGIQYSWYGAGFIDFMLRGSNGNFVFAHRMRNSNINTEAFMRSGNLPVRYEVTNEGPPGKLAAAMTDSQTTIELADASFFPESGTVYIDNEIINFSGVSGNTLTGCTRSATFSNFQAGAVRSYTAGAAAAHDANTGVILISNTITPLISHWGSAFLTDGGFDEDRGYIFSYAETAIPVSTTKQTAFMIRLAPSVSNAIVGDLGERELLNRAQLLLQGIEVTSDGVAGTTPILGGIVVEGVLNPNNYPRDPNLVGWSGLSSLAQGGQPSFAQVAAGGSITWSTGVSATTALLTAQNAVTVDMTLSRDMYYTSELRVSNATYNSLGPIAVGSVVTLVSNTYAFGGGTFYSNTTVTRVSQQGGEYRIQLSNVNYYYIGTGSTVRFTFGSNLANRNFGYFTKASFDATGATSGTSVSQTGGTVSFPANTSINSVAILQQGATEFYEVTFNNSYSGTLTAGSGTVQVEFVEPPYAQPGETVFSFIATPGERSELNLAELKELTNTPLGGRGTFPNGPDVLAINIYKVSGANTNANIILKWGEAQA